MTNLKHFNKKNADDNLMRFDDSLELWRQKNVLILRWVSFVDLKSNEPIYIRPENHVLDRPTILNSFECNYNVATTFSLY